MHQLEQAAEAHKIRNLEGFGDKIEEKILRQIARQQDRQQRPKLSEVDPIARSLEHHLARVDGVKKVVVAGSFRRRKETVGDLDILITCRESSPVMHRFVGYDEVDEVVEQG